jgi:hypothetical protein
MAQALLGSDGGSPPAVAALLRRFGLGLVLVLVAAAIVVPSASADVVQSWNGATHIWVGTGSKNYGNHTQWVSYITVGTGSAGTCPSTQQAWTAGFYAARQVCGPAYTTWYISRWVPSGNYVCGASSWTLWNTFYGWVHGRDVACISIRV